ncbi:MAG TPA: porphobilinogen synthase [Actinomycetota bacterium]|nr:porphobilinogen synthase [Actinomycetota bacterium]
MSEGWDDRAMSFPTQRSQRLRSTSALRRVFAETRLTPDSLVAPLFVKGGIAERTPIASMPGHFQHTLESVVKEGRELAERGIGAAIVFGVPEAKDPRGKGAYDASGIAQRALSALKDELGDGFVCIADLCMCSYTDHGHCGILDESSSIDNDETIDLYGRIASSQAKAGADVVAPSGMMDGQVAAIRSALDARGHRNTPILAYAAKFASSFYGPFRDAAEGAPQFGDRKTYQADSANADAALRDAALDLEEGADALMVKPALGYLDIVAAVKQRFEVPTVAYNVSGEYSMLMAAAERGWIDERSAALEVLLSIRRAGADLVITYHAKKAAEWLA